MLRFIIVVIFLVLFLVLSIPVLIAEWLLAKVSKKTADHSSLSLVQWAFGVIRRLSGVELTVIGEERIPDEPVLYIGNHRSYFDIILTYERMKSLTGYVAKKEMLRYPLLVNWMKRVNCLFLDRDNPKEGLKMILQAIEYIKSGISIFIFPEGTRNSGNELSMLEFHAGSFKIAEKSGCPIVPVAINNSAFIFEEHLPRIKKTHVIIEYGEPIYPKDLSKEEKRGLAEHCRNVIQETINRNHALV
ncbi:1-acyl-sn-glycerol-3-phosphate acyltransferase [Lachnospiraceae bacterium PF1-21]|uniref:lysophospholipid acyltransferase family protein n=1 Tax=Ohessyouella blattaphilus TaxID=2949333 RepID=UPI002566556B|nr:1-acyl-sn-glycerol-3-phosphate acyltransferase [Lachnospiraceae bacterium OttesenSCG-928-J05]